MRKALVVVVAVVAVAATSCSARQLEIEIGVYRPVTVRHVGGETTVTITGIVGCSGGTFWPYVTADGEPLDTFVTITQGDRRVRASDSSYWPNPSLTCSSEPKNWTLTWASDPRDNDELLPGPAVIEVSVSTNPGGYGDDLRADEASASDIELRGEVTIAS